MTATLEKAFGYQGDNMNLPVAELAAALPFYETVLGFQVVSRGDSPHNSAVLARDQVQRRARNCRRPGPLLTTSNRSGIRICESGPGWH